MFGDNCTGKKIVPFEVGREKNKQFDADDNETASTAYNRGSMLSFKSANSIHLSFIMNSTYMD